LRLLLLGLAAAAVAAGAHANEVDNARSLDIAVSGRVSQHCAIGSIADMDFGNLEKRGSGIRSQVAFDCNLPFTMTIKSAQGALTNIDRPNGQGPYGGSVPYSLAVEMPLRRPATQMLDRTFDSRQLRAGGVISSSGGIATDGMVLAVELGTPSGEAGLLAGEYAETITITVSPI